jgi:hypothetical protein
MDTTRTITPPLLLILLLKVQANEPVKDKWKCINTGRKNIICKSFERYRSTTSETIW